MKVSIFKFTAQKCREYFLAVGNLCRFLLYFYAVFHLIRTLFSPWKRVYIRKSGPGFSLSEFGSRLSFNLISVTIGLILRLAIITIYLISQITIFISILPLFFIYILLTVTVLYPVYLIRPTDEEVKQKMEQKFLKYRLLKPENRSAVETWFTRYYETYIHKTQWWRLHGLFDQPPLTQNWSTGYTVNLDKYATDLTRLLPHSRNLVGRKKEIDQIEQILAKSEESNVVLVGEDGVGKHTILEEMAKRMYLGKTSGYLAYKRMVEVRLEQLLSENIDTDRKKETVREIFDEAVTAGNIVIVLNTFDRYVADAQGRLDLTSVIEPFVKTNRVQCIGVTTPFLYQKFVFPNTKIRNIFQKVDVFEINKDEAITIICDAAFDFEKQCHVLIPYEVIQTIIEKSDFYITNIPFPEKAIQLLDEICVSQATKQRSDGVITLTTEIVDEILSAKLHLPTSLTEDVRAKLAQLEPALSAEIIDQPEAVAKTAASVQKSFLLIGKRTKPLATLLFLGPTGVGKTQTAKVLTNVFFGSDKYLYRFDMSQFQSSGDIPKLIGATDTGQPGELTEIIRNNPYGVLLLDEFEKADGKFINIFLTVLDEGYFTDGAGKRVDCKNLIVIATSNAGSERLYEQSSDTSKNEKPDDRKLIDYIIREKIYSPELLNRFDEIVVFRSLSLPSILKIARQQVDTIAENIQKLHHIRLDVSDAYLSTIVSRSYDIRFGARDLQRILQESIETHVTKLLLAKSIKDGDTVSL
jgi:ATP-dependent Clp protease ATP-binding subunit ClpC